MAGFLYYLPGTKRNEVNAELLRKLGLGHLLDDPAGTTFRLTMTEVARGPGEGRAGLVAGDPRRVTGGRIGFYPQEQAWRAVLGSAGRAWVGYYLEQQPRPEELARAGALDGHSLLLNDGQRWVIPVIRGVSEEEDQLVGYCAAPRLVDWDEKGERVAGEVVPRYRKFWELACLWFDLARGRALGEMIPETLEALDDLPVLALATNYAVSKTEIGMLGLLTTDLERRVCQVVIDWPTWLEHLRKKAGAAGSSTCDGPAAATGGTGRPSPT